MELQLSNGVTQIDEEDVRAIKDISDNWKLSSLGYVVGTVYAKLDNGMQVRAWTSLHRFVAFRMFGNEIDGYQIDHINNDKADNRRCNLRLATSSQNLRNQSRHRGKAGYFGVRQAWNGSFLAYYTDGRKQVHVGTFATIGEAAYARDVAVRAKFGDRAKYNNVEPVQISPRDRRHGKTGPVGIRKRQNGKWEARAKVRGIEHSIGSFASEDEAIKARKRFLAELVD